MLGWGGQPVFTAFVFVFVFVLSHVHTLAAAATPQSKLSPAEGRMAELDTQLALLQASRGALGQQMEQQQEAAAAAAAAARQVGTRPCHMAHV